MREELATGVRGCWSGEELDPTLIRSFPRNPRVKPGGESSGRWLRVILCCPGSPLSRGRTDTKHRFHLIETRSNLTFDNHRNRPFCDGHHIDHGCDRLRFPHR